MPSVSLFPLCLIAVLVALPGAPAASFAGPRVEVLDSVKVHESPKYGFFPSLQLLSTGELICVFSLNPDSYDAEANPDNEPAAMITINGTSERTAVIRLPDSRLTRLSKRSRDTFT